MAEQAECWEIVDNYPKTIQPCNLPSETILEDWIEANPDLLGIDVIIIGRQVYTDYGDYVDLLAIDTNGNIVIVENKKDIAYRDAIAQALDYASWAADLTKDKIIQISNDYFQKKKAILKLGWSNLADAFEQNNFGVLEEVTINQSQKILLVAPRPDPDAERVVRYLAVENNIYILSDEIYKLKRVVRAALQMEI